MKKYKFLTLACVLLCFLLIGIGCGQKEITITIKEKLNKDIISLTVDETQDLENNDLVGATWTSSDTTIAIMEDSTVKALKSGTCFVTGETDNYIETFVINVKDKEIEPEPEPEPEVEPEKLVTKLGIDTIDSHLDIFEGKKVGLVTNQSGVNSQYVSTIDVLYSKVNLTSLYAPEHGIRGNSKEGTTIANATDSKTGLPIYSLYGSNKGPTEEMAKNFDILCFDIQDVGARFYTYISTMAYCMKSCAAYNKTFVVFDRPNPITADIVEGNILDMTYTSFIGVYPIVQRHGMTVGELAQLFNTEYGINCDLVVIKMENYDRTQYLDKIEGMPWINPSPNMPTVDCATVYPGTCIFEGTNLSVGRGTTKPFQWIGGPYIDGEALADKLNALNLPGCTFRPVWFTPSTSNCSGQLCSGVEVHVTDHYAFKAVLTGWSMFYVIRNMYPNDFTISSSTINVNTGCNYISKNTYNLEQLKFILETDTATFQDTRKKYLISDYDPVSR